MPIYQYRIVYGRPLGMRLMPYAGQDVKDQIGPGSLEKKLNQLGEQGFEIVSCTTNTVGSFLLQHVAATVVLR